MPTLRLWLTPRMPVIPLKPRNKQASLPKSAPGPAADKAVVTSEDLYEFDLAGALRLSEGCAANGGPQDPVVLQGTTERAVRKLVAEFAFPRLPLTIGEFHALVEYCQMLDTAAGATMLATDVDMRKTWQAVSIPKYCGFFPQHAQAIRLYCAGNWTALKLLHSQERTLEKLAREYKEFGNEPI